MILNELKPRKTLNKAFLKVKPNRPEIDNFKANLIRLLDRTNDTESEEFHKNLVSDFLKDTYYKQNHFINTKGRNDLVIHNGMDAKSPVGVIIEAKKPTNRTEMLTSARINTKAFQELVLYYMRERFAHNNLEVKHLIATNIYEWFIFDATLFDRLFAQNSHFLKQFNDFESGRLADNRTDFFYKQIAEPFIESIATEIEFAYFNLHDYQEPLRNASKADDNKLIALFKLLSPEHLLKLPFINDSNSLDKRFYSELLHIVGLTETKQGSKKLIERNKEGERNSGSILEDAIIQIDSLDKIIRLEKAEHFGSTTQEKFFNVALELSITWINRILFLKLLEAQLITYHNGDKTYAFLNTGKIISYDDLNTLFFQVLARKFEDRNPDVSRFFEKVPYLNSSLFEPTELEHATLMISNLRDDKTIPIHSHTVLKDRLGKKRSGNLTTLEYLFAFLDAYDFSGEGSEEIQEESKNLINASVLGLIFEKINGYKDGSFFTPGFITMYMCRETIRRAVVQKFNETKAWKCNNLDELYDKIEDRNEANQIVNSLKICDPAVGSGHFLVSSLNEIIAIKSDLRILQDRNGRRLKEYHVEVVNDELAVTDEDGRLFEYKPGSHESQRVQETLFHEKQTIIENCLFGVDINPNSVKICRLRLWIELLKNAYYKTPTELETLPNIDINIKCGNSLISRFAIDADLKQIAKSSRWNIFSYQNAVEAYKQSPDKEVKRELEQLIQKIKSNYVETIQKRNPKLQKYYKLKQEYDYRFPENGLFAHEPDETYGGDAGKLEEEKQRLIAEIEMVQAEIEAEKHFFESHNAFEWRFEFPEVLNEDGVFRGFDVVMGNPPYGVKPDESEKEYFKTIYTATSDIYTLFFELGFRIAGVSSNISFINPISWLTGAKYKNTRNLFTDKNSILKAINLPYNIFADAYVDTGIYFFQTKANEQSFVFEFNPKDKIQIEDLINIPFKMMEGKSWKQKPDLRINFNEADNSIFSKLDSVSTKLSEFAETARGILADKAAYKMEFSAGFKRVFIGNLNRYTLEENFAFIEYDENLKEKPKDYDFFVGERILLRRIINRQFRMMATLARDEFVCKKDIYIIKLNCCDLNYSYLLALLNSKLFSFYKTKNAGSAKKDDFTQITLSDIRQLPIPKISVDKQNPFIELVGNILEAKKNNQDTTYFETQIDQLVYQLYGLTEEEIGIVEKG